MYFQNTELVSFLEVVMSATLLNLPESIRTFVYYDVLEHLANMLHVSLAASIGLLKLGSTLFCSPLTVHFVSADC